MIFTELTKKALQISFDAHQGQTDKSGMPYAYHPYRVAEQMDDENSTCVALLHDVVEDTDWTLDALRSEGFPDEVLEAIGLMTHAKSIPYMSYVQKIKTNPLATKVKLADLKDNSDSSRLKTVDKKAIERMQKYREAIDYLSDNTDLGCNVLGFYKIDEPNGYFSNWYPTEFVFAGKRYSSVEQFMMYQKVTMFKQFDLGDEILQTDDPGVVKQLGRLSIPGFDAELWERTSYAIVKRAVRAKFEQNERLFQKLIDTGDAILAECSLRDRKWGIGIDIENPDYLNTNQWNGKNYLGRILMEVRAELKNAKARGKLGYRDVRDADFPLWNSLAGTLMQNPKYHATIRAYCDTLQSDHALKAFCFGNTLPRWEIAMRTNMGGGLPIAGFYEMKQDIYAIQRLT